MWSAQSGGPCHDGRVTQSWAGSSRSLAGAFFLNSHPGLIQTMLSKRNLLGTEHPDLTPKAEMWASLDPINRKHKMKPEILCRLNAQQISSFHLGSMCKVTHHACADVPRPPKFWSPSGLTLGWSWNLIKPVFVAHSPLLDVNSLWMKTKKRGSNLRFLGWWRRSFTINMREKMDTGIRKGPEWPWVGPCEERWEGWGEPEEYR